ncbi:gibberellin-regulated protein 11-like [Salvia hispanica]|uniref:gibberellin-regulated protein 11-like n=1 Tax=Salvia hispanica TaxID=49212 RepID=UPI0020092C1A|nr:gibberellin-regulated protein 11-like [Salvia hispanica]
MPTSTSLLVCFITLLLFVSIAQLHETGVGVDGIGGGNLDEAKIDCGMECDRRCQLASRQNMCHRACGTCCSRCQCVPPGTSGNQDACPCYASLTTHNGRKKCP